MEALLVSVTTIAVAEMGDRTQLLSLILAARYGRPWPILAGILLATIANHAAAGFIGVWFGRFLQPHVLDLVVGASLIVMALWTLKPDKLDEDDSPKDRGQVFLTTLVSFFIAEIGDRTQIVTAALGARFQQVLWVAAGTTLGMMIANVPAVFVGEMAATRLPVRPLRYLAAAALAAQGVWTLLAP